MEMARQALAVCGAMLRCVWRPSVTAKRVLGVPGGIVQAFLLVRLVMCTEPSVMQRSCCDWCPIRNVCQDSGRQGYCEDWGLFQAGVFLRNKLALKMVWNLS